MHILITNRTLDIFAGSQLYVYDLALELKRQGHTVSCFTTRPGEVSARLAAHDIPTYTDLRQLSGVDIIHAHHQNESKLAAAFFPRTPIVYVCLGPFNNPERPHLGENIFTSFIAVSEDVKRYMVEQDGLPENLIQVEPNFIDTARFYPRRVVNARPKRALLISNYFTAEGLVAEACDRAGIEEIRYIGILQENVWKVEDYIDWADLVISSARGALGALAMNRPTIIYRPTGSDGMVTIENFEQLLACNFSGRAFNLQLEAESLAQEISRYNPAEAAILGELVRQRYNVKAAAERLLGLYHKTIQTFSVELPSEQYQHRLRAILGELAQANLAEAKRAWELEEYIASLIDHSKRLEAETQASQQYLAEYSQSKEEEIRNLLASNQTIQSEFENLVNYVRKVEFEHAQASKYSRKLESRLEELQARPPEPPPRRGFGLL